MNDHAMALKFLALKRQYTKTYWRKNEKLISQKGRGVKWGKAWNALVDVFLLHD